MVPPRASRRRMIINSSDNEESDSTAHSAAPQKKNPVSSQDADSNIGPRKAKRDREASSQVSSGTPKTSSQNTTKPSGKTIYSFFNAATQRLQSSQPSLQETPPEPQEGVEAIHDDSDGTSSQGVSNDVLAKGSSTALTLRKRKFKPNEGFDHDTASLAPAAQKFRKSSAGERVSPLTVYNEDKRSWIEQFPPRDLSELAVHKKKVADVRQWIETALTGRRRKVLVLKGPAGTGKTTTVVLLAQALGIDLLEWKDTSPSDYGSEGYSSSTSRFEEFVVRAGNLRGLQLSKDPPSDTNRENHEQDFYQPSDHGGAQVLLIEEFPNTFSRTSTPLKAFRSAIAQHLAAAVSSNQSPIPMIIIISETLLSTNTAAADSFTTHRLLGPELMMSPYLNVIEFNPVAPTFLIKALETIVLKEARKSGRRKTPGPQVLKHLADTGDIRSAISSLEFLCLRGDDASTWSSKITFNKSRSSKSQTPLTKSEEEALKLISNRESTLGIFHSVGKIVYNKRAAPNAGEVITHPPTWLPHHRRMKVPETDVGALFDELGTDTSTFVAALHENYASSCSSSSPEETLDSLTGCVENLSDADLLSLDRFSFRTGAFTGTSNDGLRQDEMCFQVAARGILFSLPFPVQRNPPAAAKRGDAHRMFYPASLKLWKRREEIGGKLELLISRLNLEVGSGKRSFTMPREQPGVDSWRRPGEHHSLSPTEQTAPMRTAMEDRNELILDRLPYLAQILSSSVVSPASRVLLEQVAEITHLSGTLDDQNDGDNTSDDDAENLLDHVERWTTDRPDVGSDGKARSQRRGQSSKSKNMFEGGGLAIPVESRVEKLVLEDDDIIDD